MHFNYDREKKYLVACSGGPDSMALLDMLLKDGYKVLVAHVNYKTRDESDSEEQLVKNYCHKNNIKCFVKVYSDETNVKQSFEVKARHFRYNFFHDIYFKENCEGLFVAHHKDDLLETYLLKKQRNVVNESYLILPVNHILNMIVYRPLLTHFYKDDLLNYCNDLHIIYGIDKTNFMDIHPRNVIRKQLINMDKEMVYKQALKDEKTLQDTRKEVHEFIRFYPKFTISLLSNKSDLFLSIFLYQLADSKYRKYVNTSLLLKLKDFMNSEKANLVHNIADDYYLVKEYSEILMCHVRKTHYEYRYEKLQYGSTKHFKLTQKGLKMQGIFLKEQDFPIIIRNFKSDDKITLKNGKKKVSRLFIDKKVPLIERNNVPVIENCKGEIVFVYGLYRKYGLKDVKNNLFVIK